MELKDSVFWSDNEAYRKVWEDKEWFPFLKKNLDTADEELKKLNIKRVIAFDQIGEKWEDWGCEDKLTLSVMPLCNIVDQNGSNTKERLRAMGFTAKEKYAAIDIHSDEISRYSDLAYYFPTRNLVIALANPFYDEDLFWKIQRMIFDLRPKFLTQKEIWKEKLESQWKLNFQQRQSNTLSGIEHIQNDLNMIKTNYMAKCRELMLRKKELAKMEEMKEDISGAIQKELTDLEKLPIIKELKIRDRIYVSFGEVNVTGNVKVGEEEKDGIRVPKMEPKRVKIGKLTFIIGNNEVKVKNETPNGSYQHPHADETNICYGEARVEADTLLANLEIAKLVKLLYSWAFSYNEDDAYCSLTDWYEATKNGNTN